MNSNDTRKLINGLKSYLTSLDKHINQLNTSFIVIENQWRIFNAVAEGNYADQFRNVWGKTQENFQEYINQYGQIKRLLRKSLEDLKEFDREESYLDAGTTINSTNTTALSDSIYVCAEATVTSYETCKIFNELQEEQFSLILNKINTERPKLPKPIAEGLAFEKFYVDTQIDRVIYDVQFHHNPEQEKRRADAFAILEENGEEVFSLIEIMLSGKQFNNRSSKKFYQTKAYGDTLGNSLVLKKPVKLKYVFSDKIENSQLQNLQTAVKAGIEQAVERRYRALLNEDVPSSDLTKNVKVEIEIEIWQKSKTQ